MDILFHFLFMLWFICLTVCFVGATVGIVWMIYSIIKMGDDFASGQKNLGSK